jgi:sulfopyruvate decarboxylase subunit beta
MTRMMKRDECFRILARHVTDEIVIASYSAAAEWNELNPRVLNYFSVGAMGLASSHGLGLALGRPRHRVLVLDGDGSLLMNLGSLVSIAAAAPKNLVHFVCHNGTYEANGSHPIPHAAVDFNGLAGAAGYLALHEFSQLADFEAQIPQVLQQEGPVFATLHLEKGALAPQFDYRRLDDPARRVAFRAALRGS